ncbi:hypothetical protein CDL12_22857 [Handroanthus impetiginosus]|uniref:Small auxin-up RNA n=1 Tax=Handroanthus impetiginosus TaxID=429701 RepID=A0A2G9GH29_9LAMI|nr:hypothetical protein CDL12_22857 [Handroanthus impetiginosus]
MKGGLVVLKLLMKMLRKINALSVIEYDLDPTIDQDSEKDENTLVDALPEDVKEGHFAVHAVEDGELKRFVVELSYLAHPGFLKLLKQAEEEFGFNQTGVLEIPCTYSDLQAVVGSKK